MKSAELKEKRVRHCYPRQEVYHRFIHEDKLMWSNNDSNISCSCVDNILFIRDYARHYSRYKETYPDMYRDSAIAVIDRKHKRILITEKYRSHTWNIRHSLPDNYEIFYTDKNIPCYDILKRNKRDELLKLHAKYLVDNFCRTLVTYYSVLNGISKLLYYDILDYYAKGNRCYTDIVEFVNKYKLTNRKWYKTPIFPKFEDVTWKNWTKRCIVSFDVPSIKQIIEHDIFSHEEVIKLQQVKFYTDYCYGHGIPFKDVVKNWNRTDWDRKLIAKYNRSNVDWNPEEYPTFNDFVSHTTKIINDFRYGQINKWKEQAKENRNKALEQLRKYNSSICSVNDWREKKGYVNSSYRVNYQDYVLPKNKYDMGYWTQNYVSNYGENKFTNTQLRLNNDIIETSKYASVPLNDAIKKFGILYSYIKNNKNTKDNFNLQFNNIKVGIYNLRCLKYMEKVSDDNVPLGYKEWVIVIGCHHLWLDDILNFIHYYKLEDKFNIKRV